MRKKYTAYVPVDLFNGESYICSTTYMIVISNQIFLSPNNKSAAHFLNEKGNLSFLFLWDKIEYIQEKNYHPMI